MQVSQARLEANRKNAARSTGPRSAEGKLASRGNALKHGMAASVVMVDGDVAVVDRRAEALEGELSPSGVLGRALVLRLALLSVRLERCAVHEAAATAERVRRAVDDFDDRRALEVESAFAGLGADPVGSLRRLRRMPEGVDRLVAAWQGLAADLRRPEPAWDDARGRLVDALMGRSPAEVGSSIALDLSRLILGDTPGGARDPLAPGRMLGLIDREVAKLDDHRRTLDLVAIAADRLEAPDRALFDHSPESNLARRYEAAAERGLYRALRELRQVEAEALDLPPPPAPEARPPVASFTPVPPPSKPEAPTAPSPAPPAAPVAPPSPPAPVSTPARGVSTLDFAIGRSAPAPDPSVPVAPHRRS